ncbi:MAG: hypothetical protein ABJB47_21730 [Actinomycetota bacterium]
MSTAFLYLAIIAIWAGVLVPRLVRKSQNHQADDTPELADSTDDAGHDDADASGYDDGTADAEDFPDTVDTEEISMPRSFRHGGPLWTERSGWRAFGANRTSRGDGAQHDHSVRTGVTRAAAIRARRRSLTMLVTLVLLAAVLTGAGLAPAWLLVPPVGMLGGFLILLREAAQCDAEAAERHAEARAAHAARVASAERRRVRVEQERAAEHVERNAEIIDISGRVGDQLYDQYADAAVRAVGD